ncbi:MAG TPA: extracellular solute-binding protein [Terriglobales bacterium]|nr:extracellular solute-binding protein [Terriglobales bacterium]
MFAEPQQKPLPALGLLVPVLFAVTLTSCGRKNPEPVALNYFRLGWLAQPDDLSTAAPLLKQFTDETGIRLRNLPVPESTLDQVDLSRKLLHQSGSGPDVLGVDLIWAGDLEANLIDLRPYLASELASLEPRLVSSYTIGDKIVAIPYSAQVGVLEYRTDLLREYGYDHPPRTWNELENMAARIQAGERAKGKKDFWGYVWQGAAAEALTCNALEWQAAEGGGRIIERNRTVSVNNPAAIRSWQRARRWIGWISPPSVVEYRELDSMSVFDSGNAAFDRVWGGVTITPGNASRLYHLRNSPMAEKTGYTSIPGGAGGRAGTLGGAGLAVSRNSTHPREAIELVRFLIRAETRSNQSESASSPPAPTFTEIPFISAPRGGSDKTEQGGSEIVRRPSREAGQKYEQVTRLYIDAVHSVLVGQKNASDAAAELEKQIVKITGFSAGAPNVAD